MTCSAFIMFRVFFVAWIATSATSQTCGPNEMEVECQADCPSDYCPKSSQQVQSCPKPDPCPENACKCIFDHRRAENGTCIPTRTCPPFECSGLNEEFNACPPLCSDDVSQATLSGDCPRRFGFILIVVPCTPACRCKKHYWRKGGTCLEYQKAISGSK